MVKMRLFTSIIASVAMLFVASVASATVTFTVIGTTVTGGRPLNALQVNDVVTIDIRLSNPLPTSSPFIGGVGGAVQGYNPSVVSFQSGEAGDGTLFCTNASCSNGLVNTFDSTTPLEERNDVPGFGPYVNFVSAITTTLRNGDGSRDPGIDGVLNGLGALFRISFVATGQGSTVLDIGTTTNPFVGNVIVSSTLATGGVVTPDGQAINASLALTVIPEPGTALLMGLGLAGLAAAGRRE